MKRAVLFCNGEIKDLACHKAMLMPDDFIVAVDGGGRFCRTLNLIPDVAIGDFDSLPAEIKEFFICNQTEMIPYPAEKDYIDTVLAIETVIERGYDEILILGALGGKRTDMTIGNLMCLSLFDKNIVVRNETTEVRYILGGQKMTLAGRVGDYCSLIPLSHNLSTGKSIGLKYQLDKLSFRRGETRSISNEFSARNAEIEIISGEALIIIERNS